MHKLSRARAQALLAHELPEPSQVDHVGAQRLLRRVLGGGAHDEARGLVRFETGLNGAAQPLPLALVLHACRHADPAALGHVHEKPRRQRDVGREPRAFGSERIFHHLHEDLVALGNQCADVLAAGRLDTHARVARVEDVRGMQERRALHADVDERRLHPRQDARDPSFVDVADEPAAIGALDEHFLQHAALDHGGARLVRARVDQNFSAHRSPRFLSSRASTARPPRAAAARSRKAAAPSHPNSCRAVR
jgi:hypothetical protein